MRAFFFLPVARNLHGLQKASGGLLVIDREQSRGDAIKFRGLGAEPVSAAAASRPRPPVTAVIPVQIVGLLP